MTYQPPGYACKRYALIIVCSLQILGCIIIGALSNVMANALVDSTYPKNPDNHKIYLITFIVVAVIGIIFELFGLIGAIKENYCLSMTFVVLQVLGTISSVVSAFGTPGYWGSVVFSILVTIIAILFVMDLRKIRNSEQTQQAQARAYHA